MLSLIAFVACFGEPVWTSPIVLTPDERTACAVDEDAGTVRIWAWWIGTPVREVAVGEEPRTLAISPAGDRLYATCQRPQPLAVVALAEARLLATIPIPSAWASLVACALLAPAQQVSLTPAVLGSHPTLAEFREEIGRADIVVRARIEKILRRAYPPLPRSRRAREPHRRPREGTRGRPPVFRVSGVRRLDPAHRRWYPDIGALILDPAGSSIEAVSCGRAFAVSPSTTVEHASPAAFLARWPRGAADRDAKAAPWLIRDRCSAGL